MRDECPNDERTLRGSTKPYGDASCGDLRGTRADEELRKAKRHLDAALAHLRVGSEVHKRACDAQLALTKTLEEIHDDVPAWRVHERVREIRIPEWAGMDDFPGSDY